MAKDDRRCSPALDCLELNFESGADEETESRAGDVNVKRELLKSCTDNAAGMAQKHVQIESNTQNLDEKVESEMKMEAGDGDDKDSPEDLDPLHMECIDPEVDDLHMEGEEMEHHAHASEALGEDEGSSRDPDADPRDLQKIGPPILSPYLQIHQIEPSRCFLCFHDDLSCLPAF